MRVLLHHRQVQYFTALHYLLSFPCLADKTNSSQYQETERLCYFSCCHKNNLSTQRNFAYRRLCSLHKYYGRCRWQQALREISCFLLCPCICSFVGVANFFHKRWYKPALNTRQHSRGTKRRCVRHLGNSPSKLFDLLLCVYCASPSPASFYEMLVAKSLVRQRVNAKQVN